MDRTQLLWLIFWSMFVPVFSLMEMKDVAQPGTAGIGSKYKSTEHWLKLHTSASLLIIGLVLATAIIMSIWHEHTAPAPAPQT